MDMFTEMLKIIPQIWMHGVWFAPNMHIDFFQVCRAQYVGSRASIGMPFDMRDYLSSFTKSGQIFA
jgi:hypothetical protein